MAEEIYQVFVKLLDGKSKALNFSSTSSISPLSIKRRLSGVTGIPVSDQILVSGTKILSDGPHTFPIFCHLTLRLCGGKGGFGSLLRGAATKAGQKKTNNFDACRDMSGRRLRHVNVERRLEEWAAEAEERRLERAAEEFLRKKVKAEGRSRKAGGGAETEKYVSKYREDSARCMEVVEKSVREALGKKRKAKAGLGGEDSKKLKIWMGKGKLDNSDSDETDDSDEDNENSVVLDNENRLDSIEELEVSSDSVTGGKIDGSSSAGGSSENSSDGDEEAVFGDTLINVESSGEAMVEETVQQNGAVSPLEEAVFSETAAVWTENVADGKLPTVSGSWEGETLELGTTDAEMSLSLVPKPVVEEEIVAKSTDVVDPVKPLNFEEFNSSTELEALGMEKLKSELQLWGLKCGGTLQERAARLFLLKTTPLEKLPKKLLAKK